MFNVIDFSTFSFFMCKSSFQMIFFHFQHLTKNLAYKEELIKQLAASSGVMTDTKNDSEIQMKELQEQINSLVREKDELTEQIRTMQHSSVGNK